MRNDISIINVAIHWFDIHLEATLSNRLLSVRRAVIGLFTFFLYAAHTTRIAIVEVAIS